jgi:CBS domain-containing protein
MKARDIMTSTVECVTAKDNIQGAARIMRDEDVGIVPVVEEAGGKRTLRGVVTDRDIAVRCVAEGKDVRACTVADVMSSNLVTVRPDADVKEVMEKMKKAQVRRIPVVEDGNRLVGIIAQADLATQGAGDKAVGDVVEKISEPGGRR